MFLRSIPFFRSLISLPFLSFSFCLALGSRIFSDLAPNIKGLGAIPDYLVVFFLPAAVAAYSFVNKPQYEAMADKWNAIDKDVHAHVAFWAAALSLDYKDFKTLSKYVFLPWKK